MAIKNLNERYPEIGRIRLGDKEIKNGKERPVKGEHLRFTSNDDVALKAIASQHGGDVVAWEKGEQRWQLTSETTLIEALLPPDPLADTPIYERWGSGGIQRRCDGERCIVPVADGDGGSMVESDCACLAEGVEPGDNKDTKACKVTLRIRVVLPFVPGLGVWLCTSHSWIGALELPGQVALIESMRERGQLVPVFFGIEPRSLKKPWESYRRDFIVPVLRIRTSYSQLAAGLGDPMAALGDGGATLELGQKALPPPEPPKAPVTPPKAATKPPKQAAPNSPRPSGPSPFPRAIRNMWRPVSLPDADLDALCQHVIQRANPEAVEGAEEANRMLAAIKQVGETLNPVYGDDGSVSWAETVEPSQGTLA